MSIFQTSTWCLDHQIPGGKDIFIHAAYNILVFNFLFILCRYGNRLTFNFYGSHEKNGWM